MIYYHILRFIKNPAKCCAVLLLWIGLICWFLTDSFYSSHFQGAIDLTLPTLPYIFLVFIALSYECFYDIRRAQLEEVFCVGKKNSLGIQFFDFILLLTLNVITSVIVYIYHSWFYLQRDLQKRYNEMFDQLEQVGHSMKGKTFVVSPEDNSCNWCVGKDHIVDRLDGFSEILDYYQRGVLYTDYEQTEDEYGMILNEYMEKLIWMK